MGEYRRKGLKRKFDHPGASLSDAHNPVPGREVPYKKDQVLAYKRRRREEIASYRANKKREFKMDKLFYDEKEAPNLDGKDQKLSESALKDEKSKRKSVARYAKKKQDAAATKQKSTGEGAGGSNLAIPKATRTQSEATIERKELNRYYQRGEIDVGTLENMVKLAGVPKDRKDFLEHFQICVERIREIVNDARLDGQYFFTAFFNECSLEDCVKLPTLVAKLHAFAREYFSTDKSRIQSVETLKDSSSNFLRDLIIKVLFRKPAIKV